MAGSERTTKKQARTTGKVAPKRATRRTKAPGPAPADVSPAAAEAPAPLLSVAPVEAGTPVEVAAPVEAAAPDSPTFRILPPLEPTFTREQWVGVVFEGSGVVAHAQAGVFTPGTRTRLRGDLANQLFGVAGFRFLEAG